MNQYLACRKRKSRQQAVAVCIAFKCPKLNFTDDKFTCTYKPRGERELEKRRASCGINP